MTEATVPKIGLEGAARLALEAIESGESFDYLDNVVAPVLRKALAELATGKPSD